MAAMVARAAAGRAGFPLRMLSAGTALTLDKQTTTDFVVGAFGGAGTGTAGNNGNGSPRRRCTVEP